MALLKVGDKGINNVGQEYTVIEYINSRKVSIKFTLTGYIATKAASNIINGQVSDLRTPAVEGIGYLDGETCKVKSRKKRSYTIWNNILRRCYNKSDKAYKYYGGHGVTVDPRWHSYKEFNQWYINQCKALGVDTESKEYEIDKDKRALNVKVYCPENCELMTHKENCQHRVKKYNSKFGE